MMADPGPSKQAVLAEIVNRKNLGDKRFHSETSLQNFGEDEGGRSRNTSGLKDPGVLNSSINNMSSSEEAPPRVRHVSQPGPVSSNLVTATAARAARRKPLRTVNYAVDLERTESTNGPSPKLFLSVGNDSGTATPTLGEGRDGSSPVAYINNFRNGDSKSLTSYRPYTPSDYRGTTPRKRSTANDAFSIRSIETQAPPPTSPEENKRLTTKYLALIASSMYAILLVTLGIIVYVAEPFMDEPVATYYSMVLTVVGFTYHIYLFIDINRYKKIALKNEKIKAVHDDNLAEYFRKQEENYGMDIGDRTTPPKPPPPLIPLKHIYCFSQGRHSGSFYLKMGAAGFAVGHLIHAVLLIAVQLAYLVDETIDNDKCLKIERIVLDLFIPLNSLVQLYFIFKYSNVIILRNQSLAYFGFMHMIGSSLCFWVSTIARETMLALTLYANSVSANNNTGHKHDDTSFEETDDDVSSRVAREAALGFNRYNFKDGVEEECRGSEAIASIFENYSPYLYPFSVEFNILIVAVYYIIWSNIGNCSNEEGNFEGNSNSSLDENYAVCKIPTASVENDFTSNVVIYADCHASNRGMFTGLIVIVLIAGSIILNFVFNSVDNDYYHTWGYLVTDITKLTLNVVMLVVVILAYTQLRKLDINEHPISLLDDILLFICLPAFFMEVTLSMVATITYTNIIKSVDFMVMVIQVIIQTALLVDGLRRCSNSRKLRRKKPGRELIMFLIIANVGTWLLYTLSYKSPESSDERYVFYGKKLWTILGHISLPLIMFYRFHSSVCFADIWGSAYSPGSEH